MSTGYNRLKKYRELRKPADEFAISSGTSNDECQLECQMDVDVIHKYSSLQESTSSNNPCDNLSDFTYSSPEHSVRSPEYQSTQESSSSECNSIHESDCYDVVTVPSLRQKLQGWAVRFRSNLTVETIDNLLEILRDEQLPDLPKSAATLLETKSNYNENLQSPDFETNIDFSINDAGPSSSSLNLNYASNMSKRSREKNNSSSLSSRSFKNMKKSSDVQMKKKERSRDKNNSSSLSPSPRSLKNMNKSSGIQMKKKDTAILQKNCPLCGSAAKDAPASKAHIESFRRSMDYRIKEEA